MLQDAVVSHELKGPNFVIKPLRDWPGTGRACLHRGWDNNNPMGSKQYWAMYQSKDGDEVPVGEIFLHEVMESIVSGQACLSVLTKLGLPTDPVELEATLRTFLPRTE